MRRRKAISRQWAFGGGRSGEQLVERRGNYLLYVTEVTVCPTVDCELGSGDRKAW